MKKAKKYQIKVKNASDDDRYCRLYDVWTSKKKAQKMADGINAIDPTRDASVVECK